MLLLLLLFLLLFCSYLTTPQLANDSLLLSYKAVFSCLAVWNSHLFDDDDDPLPPLALFCKSPIMVGNGW